MHLLVLKHVVLLEVAILLHGQECVVGSVAHAWIVILLKGEEMVQIDSVRLVLSSCCAIRHTEVPDLVNISLVQVKRVPA